MRYIKMVCWIWFVNSIMKYIGYWSQAGGFYPLPPTRSYSVLNLTPGSQICTKRKLKVQTFLEKSENLNLTPLNVFQNPNFTNS